jgi:hypothetical protein
MRATLCSGNPTPGTAGGERSTLLGHSLRAGSGRLRRLRSVGKTEMLWLPINRMNAYLPPIRRRGPVHASDSLPAAASPWVKRVARASPCASMGDAEGRRLGKSGDHPSVPSFIPGLVGGRSEASVLIRPPNSPISTQGHSLRGYGPVLRTSARGYRRGHQLQSKSGLRPEQAVLGRNHWLVGTPGPAVAR